MPVAYTPGLRVTREAVIRQERRLPMQGEVLVQAGDTVSAEAVVARAERPGNLHTIRAAQMLHVEPQELESYLVKQRGEAVSSGEVLAMTKGLWGLFKSEVRSPIAGVVEEVSAASGYVRVREQAELIEVRAHIAGRVAEIIAGEGAVIEARGALVQGIFGVGGERRGRLRVMGQGPGERLRPELIEECEGCVLVAGAGADGKAIARAAEAGAVGLVVGAVSDATLREYVGYDIGVAITGQEAVPMTLILTEGFGELPMARRTWELLRSLEGELASIDGATQIRAGVMRPEIIVTRAGAPEGLAEAEAEQNLVVGARVRVIREPHFGALGKVTAMPVELTEIETESRVRVAMVELDGGDVKGQEQAPAERGEIETKSQVRVPRANLELMQE